MQISSNSINRQNIAQNAIIKAKKTEVNLGNNTQQLPSVYVAGVSQINSNLPVSYIKLGEIPIPGLKNNASVFRLANGQRVVILPKKGPTQIRTTFNVGSLNETEDIRGISHFIEHNLFNGSKNLAPKEYDKKVSNMGGYTNASTGYNATDYYMTIQLLDDNFLEEGIKLNAEQTQFPTFPPEQITKEKEAVKSEIDVYKDQISDVAESRMLKNLFGINTQSTNFILGTKQNINSFDQAKVLDYYNTWYTPDNAVTVITGDVDVNETINLVSKYFNKKNDYSKINQRHSEPISYTTKPIRNDFVQKGSPYSNISMGFAMQEGTSEYEKTAVNFLLSMLESPNSKLTKALDKYGITPYFYTNPMENKPNGAQAIMTSISLPEEQVEDVIKILYEEITKFANSPIDLQEFQEIQTSMLKGIDTIAEYSEDINATLTHMAINNNYNYINNKKQFISTITPNDIVAVARKFLDLNKVSLCVGHAENTTAEKINHNYKTANSSVSFGKSNPLNNIQSEISKVREFKLWNNIETTIIPAPSSGKSTLQMTIQTDLMKDVPQSALDILSELLNRGSAQSGVENYNRTLTKNDIGLWFGASNSGIEVLAKFYDDKLCTTTNVLKEILANPNFTEAEFQRAKQNIKDSLLSASKSAQEAIDKELFSDVKSYNTKQEQLAEIDNITLADVQNLYSRIMANAQCEVTGTMPVEEKPYLQDVLNTELSRGLPIFQNAIINREANTKLYKPNTQAKTIVQAEERAQAEIIQAYTYPKSYNIDDIAKIKLLNIILGSGMSSRLFKSLREEEKLCYSVHSSLSYQNDTGIIQLDIETTTDPETKGEGSPENATRAINAFNKNVEMLKTQGVSQEELNQAKNRLKTMLLDLRESNYGINNQMHYYRNSAYGLKHLETYYSAIDKITVEDIKAAANYVFKNPPITSIVASQKTLDELNLK